ncbi:putative phage related protein [Lactococcus cremoris subsp. cremoris GE214]|uniref:Putative phage related protein n=1 Tax=Lactococcus cremoris subsp. cremoris GE214 TaxID=1415168 RepID=A0A084A6V8_LACLC|nr:putative phage related protein [Lactococcus cremoris subsp. cremoris GE214]
MTSQNHYTFILHFFIFGFKLRNRDIVITIFLLNYLRSHFTTIATI